MAQQVNLCLPVLRQQQNRFAAQTLALALLVVLSVGSALGFSWIYRLNRATTALRANLEAQTKEMDALRAAIEQRAKSAAPAEQALQQELNTRREALQQRDRVLAALSQGHFEAGRGHAARLQLIASSIPPVVWVTQIRADERLLEISGYTLEPAVLNDWVHQLAASALLRDQALSTIKVEAVKPESVLLPVTTVAPLSAAAKLPMSAVAPASAASVPLPSMWSFSLLSKAPALPAKGAKP